MSQLGSTPLDLARHDSTQLELGWVGMSGVGWDEVGWVRVGVGVEVGVHVSVEVKLG